MVIPQITQYRHLKLRFLEGQGYNDQILRVLKEVETEVSSDGELSLLAKQFQQQYVTVFISIWLDPANY